MGDVDILVPRERMGDVAGRLAAAGVAEKDTGPVTTLPSYYARTFQVDGVGLDVHHSFVQRTRNRVDYAALWARRVPLPDLGPGAARLDDVDAIVQHAVALAKDELRVPLIRYVDLWLMMRARSDAGAAAAARAREWGVERALYGALRLAGRLFPDLDAGQARAVRDGLLSGVSRRFLDRRVLPDPWEHGTEVPLSRRAQLWRKLWLMDGFGRRLAFAAYHGYAVLRTRGAGPAPGEAAAASGPDRADTPAGRG
jgi:hypothetical protein